MPAKATAALKVVERVLRIPDLVLLDLSRDDGHALLLSNRSGSYQLWALRLRDGMLRQVSHGEERVSWAKVAPDSRTVAFLRDFGGNERHKLFVGDVSGAPERRVGRLRGVRAFQCEWAPRDQIIALVGSTRRENCLWLLDVPSGSMRKLYSSRGPIFFPEWHRDGSLLACSVKSTEAPRSLELLFISPEDGTSTIYTPKHGSENSGPRWHPGKRLVLFKTNVTGPYDLAIYDVEAKEVEHLYLAGLGDDFTAYGWLPSGEGIWFVAKRAGRCRLYTMPLRGEARPLPVPEGSISNAIPSSDGSFFLLSWSSLTRPPRLLKLKVGAKRPVQLAVERAAQAVPRVEAKFVSYPSFDGLQIPSFLLLYRAGRPKGCVVWVHGGPWWEVADEWNPAIMALCAGGFHVLCPNFRGSTGYGAEFERMNIGDPGGADLQDIVHGRRYLLEAGLAPEGKVAIAGASYGGFMTYLALVKSPELWSAGAAIVGITDWLEMYELSDAVFRSFIEELLGKPEEKASLFRDRSAINFVENIRAPLLIWHRANDSRCPLAPVQKFVDRLRQLGRPHEFHVVKGEGHGPQKVENLVRQYKAVVAFLARHLGQGAKANKGPRNASA